MDLPPLVSGPSYGTLNVSLLVHFTSASSCASRLHPPRSLHEYGTTVIRARWWGQTPATFALTKMDFIHSQSSMRALLKYNINTPQQAFRQYLMDARHLLIDLYHLPEKEWILHSEASKAHKRQMRNAEGHRKPTLGREPLITVAIDTTMIAQQQTNGQTRGEKKHMQKKTLEYKQMMPLVYQGNVIGTIAVDIQTIFGGENQQKEDEREENSAIGRERDVDEENMNADEAHTIDEILRRAQRLKERMEHAKNVRVQPFQSDGSIERDKHMQVKETKFDSKNIIADTDSNLDYTALSDEEMFSNPIVTAALSVDDLPAEVTEPFFESMLARDPIAIPNKSRAEKTNIAEDVIPDFAYKRIEGVSTAMPSSLLVFCIRVRSIQKDLPFGLHLSVSLFDDVLPFEFDIGKTLNRVFLQCCDHLPRVASERTALLVQQSILNVRAVSGKEAVATASMTLQSMRQPVMNAIKRLLVQKGDMLQEHGFALLKQCSLLNSSIAMMNRDRKCGDIEISIFAGNYSEVEALDALERNVIIIQRFVRGYLVRKRHHYVLRATNQSIDLMNREPISLVNSVESTSSLKRHSTENLLHMSQQLVDNNYSQSSIAGFSDADEEQPRMGLPKPISLSPRDSPIKDEATLPMIRSFLSDDINLGQLPDFLAEPQTHRTGKHDVPMTEVPVVKQLPSKELTNNSVLPFPIDEFKLHLLRPSQPPTPTFQASNDFSAAKASASQYSASFTAAPTEKASMATHIVAGNKSANMPSNDFDIQSLQEQLKLLKEELDSKLALIQRSNENLEEKLLVKLHDSTQVKSISQQQDQAQQQQASIQSIATETSPQFQPQYQTQQEQTSVQSIATETSPQFQPQYQTQQEQTSVQSIATETSPQFQPQYQTQQEQTSVQSIATETSPQFQPQYQTQQEQTSVQSIATETSPQFQPQYQTQQQQTSMQSIAIDKIPIRNASTQDETTSNRTVTESEVNMGRLCFSNVRQDNLYDSGNDDADVKLRDIVRAEPNFTAASHMPGCPYAEHCDHTENDNPSFSVMVDSNSKATGDIAIDIQIENLDYGDNDDISFVHHLSTSAFGLSPTHVPNGYSPRISVLDDCDVDDRNTNYMVAEDSLDYAPNLQRQQQQNTEQHRTTESTFIADLASNRRLSFTPLVEEVTSQSVDASQEEPLMQPVSLTETDKQTAFNIEPQSSNEISSSANQPMPPVPSMAYSEPDYNEINNPSPKVDEDRVTAVEESPSITAEKDISTTVEDKPSIIAEEKLSACFDIATAATINALPDSYTNSVMSSTATLKLAESEARLQMAYAKGLLQGTSRSKVTEQKAASRPMGLPPLPRKLSVSGNILESFPSERSSLHSGHSSPKSRHPLGHEVDHWVDDSNSSSDDFDEHLARELYHPRQHPVASSAEQHAWDDHFAVHASEADRLRRILRIMREHYDDDE